MQLFLASEFRATIYKNECYLATRAFVIYERYAKAFGDIVLCSRVIRVDEIPEDCVKADFIKKVIECEKLEHTVVGMYKKNMLDAIKECDLVVGRFPSIIAFKACDYAKKLGKIFIAELMCDGWDSYWNHSIAGKLIAPYMTCKMKKCTWDADYAIYVTEKYLQNKYPCKNPSINASNVVIKEYSPEILKRRLEKIEKMDKHNISMMTSASIDQHSKGQEYVVKAIKILKERGINVTYYLAGSGKQEYLYKFAQAAGVSDNLIFLGRLSIEKIFEKLDDIDIYIQPSLQEGLPRSVIEALSRACPVMGARTAGIPELMDSECVFDRRSEKSIAKAVEKVIGNGLEKYAKNSFENSKKYHNDVLDDRRNRYFEIIREKAMSVKS